MCFSPPRQRLPSFINGITMTNTQPFLCTNLGISAVGVFFLLIPIVTLCGTIYILQGVTLRIWASQVALLVRNLPANAGDVRDAGSIPGMKRSPGGGHGHPLQYSCLENPMDRGAWWATVHGVTKGHD